MERTLIRFPRKAISFAAPLVLSCVHTVPEQSSPAATADAVVGNTFAQFTFPAEDSTRFVWHRESDRAYEGQPEYSWVIDWEIPDAHRGIDPKGLGLGVRWHPTGPKFGTLADLLHAAEVTVNTECMSCDIPAYLPRPDDAVRAEAIGNRVVITVRGRAAVQRIFPVRPDTVFFSRYAPSGKIEAQWTVGVRRAGRASSNTR
jgi:hypothetical protein